MHLLPSQKDPECLPNVRWSLSLLILPIAHSGNCHKIITFKIIIGQIFVLCLAGLQGVGWGWTTKTKEKTIETKSPKDPMVCDQGRPSSLRGLPTPTPPPPTPPPLPCVLWGVGREGVGSLLWRKDLICGTHYHPKRVCFLSMGWVFVCLWPGGETKEVADRVTFCIGKPGYLKGLLSSSESLERKLKLRGGLS